LPTRMLLAVTDFVTQWWWALSTGLLAVGLLSYAAVQTRAGRYARDRLLLRVPVVGTTIQYALVERFCRWCRWPA
jgi:type IV pilus assembly protein PilC